jgi:hypothetical protein
MSATGRRGVGIGSLVMALAVAWSLVAAVSAGAQTVTVGSVLPPVFKSTPFEGVRTQFNTTLPEGGANLGSPVNGAILRWKMQGAVGGPFTLRILRPNGLGAFTPVAASQSVRPNGTGIETFQTQLPIHTGDLIAVDSSNATDEIGVAEVSGAGFGIFSQPPLEGTTLAASEIKSGKEIELAAEVQPAPAITGVTGTEGSVLGGEEVSIAGTNLNGATAVSFGEVPATSFTVEGEELIRAVVPPQAQIGTVDVTATTLAGESPLVATDRFTYRGCVVPRLANKKLGVAKATVRHGGCTVGKVSRIKRPKRFKGKVVHQGPRPGLLLAPGAKVSIKLGK